MLTGYEEIAQTNRKEDHMESSKMKRTVRDTAIFLSLLMMVFTFIMFCAAKPTYADTGTDYDDTVEV